jgi:hypothetical protein
MDEQVSTKIGHWLARHVNRPSLAGNGLPERVRTTTFALLGLTAAAGLGLVAIFSQQGWPLLSPSPIPSPPTAHEAIHPALAVADRAETGFGETTVALGPALRAPAAPSSPIQGDGSSAGLDARHPVRQGASPGAGGQPQEPASPEPAAPTPAPTAPPAPSAEQAPSSTPVSTPAPAPSSAPKPSGTDVDEADEDDAPGNSQGHAYGHSDSHGHSHHKPPVSSPPQSEPEAPEPAPAEPAPEEPPTEPDYSTDRGHGHGFGHWRH